MIRKYPKVKKDMPLITNGFFKSCRNTNFLGEIFIYLSFAVITGNPISYYILASVWSLFFTGSMFMKEMSLSKKKGWLKYKAQSNLLLPRVLSNYYLDLIFWGVAFYGSYHFHKNFDEIMLKL